MTTNYGRDTSCTDSLRTGRIVSGAMAIGEAAYRRLSTSRGTLRGREEEANYGEDLAEFVGKQASPSTSAMLPAIIRNELDKDERILSTEVDVTTKQDGPSVTYLVAVSCTTAEGPFTLQMSVSNVRVSLLGITTQEAA
jgi:hypothetical protein